MKKLPKSATLDLTSLYVEDYHAPRYYGQVRPLSGSAIYFRFEGDAITFQSYRNKPIAAGELLPGATLEIRVARSWYAARG